MSGGGKSSEQTVGYKYYAGMHMVLCHGPIDKIVKIEVDDRTAWEGSAEASASPVRVDVDKPGLFGGESREGGIKGALDVLFGFPGQPRSDYLLSKIGSSLVSAYRGVTSVVLRQMYLGNNPYLKPWAFTAQRIHLQDDGQPQWLDELAEVLTGGDYTETLLEERFDSGLDDYTLVEGDWAAFSIDDGELLVSPVTVPIDRIRRTFPSGPFGGLQVDLEVVANGPDDSGVLQIEDAAGGVLFSCFPVRQTAVDSQRRFHLNSPDGQMGDVLSDEQITTGERYTLLAVFGADGYTAQLTQGGAVVGRVSGQLLGDLEDAAAVVFRTENSDGGGTMRWDNLRIFRRVETGDMNPAHIIRECLTNATWGRGLPASEIGPSYEAVAGQLFTEGFGLSMMWTEEAPLEDFINEVMRHIDAVRYEDPETGLQEIKLIRGDYDVAALPVLDRSNSEVTKFDNTAISELVNQVTVKYWNRAGDTDSAITVQDTAAITQVGSIVNATYEYPGITRDDVAMMVAQRDLAAGSRPYARGTVVVNRQVANLKPGDVFVLEDPDLGIQSMVCRVAKRTDSGLLNGQLTLEWGEDVFASQYSLFATPPTSGWDDPVGAPQAFSHSAAFEIPYVMIVRRVGDSYIDQVPADAAYYGFAGTRPGAGAHLNYDLYAYPDGTSQAPDFELAEKADFTPYAVVASDIDDPSEPLIPVNGIIDPEGLRTGQLVLVGEVDDTVRELAALDAAVASGDTSLTLKRGVADTVPRPIAAGTVLYVIGDQAGSSGTEWVEGETVEGYGTPVNGQGHYEGPYTYHDVTMAGRFARPYPPANLQFEGQYGHQRVTILADDAGDLTWVHRDRVTQSDQMVGWFEAASTGPEAGTSYRLEAFSVDANGDPEATPYHTVDLGLVSSHTFDAQANPPAPGSSAILLRLWAVRDGQDSLQSADIQLAILRPPSGLVATYVAVNAPDGLTATYVT